MTSSMKFFDIKFLRQENLVGVASTKDLNYKKMLYSYIKLLHSHTKILKVVDTEKIF